ncbi:MAG: hypothetical protein LBF93_08120 [Zoogloeaceae bacterium]|jgi:hypothetical protein|nr:hypothetical protein [Zoogloeaceae bacterium]
MFSFFLNLFLFAVCALNILLLAGWDTGVVVIGFVILTVFLGDGLRDTAPPPRAPSSSRASAALLNTSQG